MPEQAFGRHALAWLDPGRLAKTAWTACGREAADAFARWAGQAWPAVVRRRQPGDIPGCLPLGIALPPDQGKRRLAACVAPASVRETRPPLTLAEAVAAAPAAWQADLLELDRRLRGLDLLARVYGSLAWQALTGQAYFTADSDVDLILQPNSDRQLDRLLEALQVWERDTGRRADGEILFPGQRAVAWREMAQGTERVLAKSGDGFGLTPVQTLLTTLAAEERAA